MPLLGSAAMLLSFDVDSDAIAEHDHWHSVEHLPERLSVPGFRRGSRWVATRSDGPRYLVLYEVAELAILSSAPYRARLERPTPWTARMMAHYRGMRRAFCTVLGSHGVGVGGCARLWHWDTTGADAGEADHALLDRVLPEVAALPGVTGVHLLRGGVRPEMTREQRIRGADGGIDTALIVTGHVADALEAVAASALSPSALAAIGVPVAAVAGRYRLAHTLSTLDLGR